MDSAICSIVNFLLISVNASPLDLIMHDVHRSVIRSHDSSWLQELLIESNNLHDTAIDGHRCANALHILWRNAVQPRANHPRLILASPPNPLSDYDGYHPARPMAEHSLPFHVPPSALVPFILSERPCLGLPFRPGGDFATVVF